MKFRENEHLFLGVPIMFFSFLSLAWNIHGLYQYNFSEKLFLFEIPNKILIINIVIAILGIVLSVETMKGRLNVSKSLLIFMFLILVYIFLNTVFVQIF